MYHFFAEHENIHDSYIDIVGSDVNHIKNVLRFKEGDKLLISSGDNVDYECSIASMSDEYIRADILSKDEQGKELPSRIILFQGLPKADKMELIIQKAVELGAYSVVPVAMKRSVVKLDAKKAKAKVERWNGIALSAAKQSKRSIQPEVTEVMTFKQALEYAGKLDKLLLPYECAEGMEKTRKVIEEIGHEVVEIRQKKDLEGIDGIILPGGESTVQGQLLRKLDMLDTIKSAIADGLPTLATCAGLILLAGHIDNDNSIHIGTLPVTVKRNAYGRQLGSFVRTAAMKGFDEFPMTFIRAPYISSVSDNVDVLAAVDDRIVAVQYNNQIGLAFHPELSGDTRIHEYFISLCEK